jgi:hypothetical protein
MRYRDDVFDVLRIREIQASGFKQQLCLGKVRSEKCSARQEVLN